MNKKISELTTLNLSSLDNQDYIPVFDHSENVTKKVALADIIGTSVGDVKSSMLTPEQFQAVNYGTWMLMNGQSCVGTTYATLTGKMNVPDAITNETFLRQKGSARELGSYQANDNKSHSHTANATAYNVNAAIGGVYFRNVNKISAGMDEGVGNIAHYTTNTNAINSTGSTEARPNNIAVNFFIRVD